MSLNDIKNKYYPYLEKWAVYEHLTEIQVALIVVGQEHRGRGIGRKIFEDINKWADQTNKIVSLTPSSDFGGNKNKLIKFYKSLGFVLNKGRDKNYEISELMYREPKTEQKINENLSRKNKICLQTLVLEETKQILSKFLIKEAMAHVLPEDHVLWIEGSQHRLYLTIRATNRKSLGTLIMRRVDSADGGVWEMDDVKADKGYGPLLYDVAIELTSTKKYFGDLGLMPDRTSVSKGASHVWKYFYENRKDVQHELIPQMPHLSENRDEWLKYYYFKNGSPVINKLLELGQIKTEDYNFL